MGVQNNMTYMEIAREIMSKLMDEYSTDMWQGQRASADMEDVLGLEVDTHASIMADRWVCREAQPDNRFADLSLEERIALYAAVEKNGYTIGKQERMNALAFANMIRNGRGFSVIRKPDWSGGYYCEVEPLDYENKSFEYTEWFGTPAQYAKQMPVFEWRVEPTHGKPMEGVVGALAFIKAQYESKRR